MKKDIVVPRSISLRNEYKRKFSFWEIYNAFVLMPKAGARISRNNRKKLISNKFIERLQLAVTEVNGCAACSYAHSYMALKQGMSTDEIRSFLSGNGNYIGKEEAKAIAFAQHYADSRGYPEKDAYQSIINEYGEEKARIILSGIQLIFVGNVIGIPFSALQSRFKGRPYRGSTLIYEIAILIAGFIVLPVAIIHGLLRSVIGFSNIRYKKNKTV